MGSSPRGILAYGYDLGGDEAGWKVAQTTGEYGGLQLDWLPDDGGMTQAGEELLRASTGFVEIPYDQPRPDGYYKASKAADEAVGVQFRRCGSPDYPSYVLCTAFRSVEWYDTEVVDPADLAREPVDHGWDDKLRKALDVLGLTPHQAGPAWLLCAFYG